MAYNTKNIIRDAAGAPVPQFYNPTPDTYQPLTGADLGGGRYGYDSLAWGKTAAGLYVPLKVADDGTVLTQLTGSRPQIITVRNQTINAGAYYTAATFYASNGIRKVAAGVRSDASHSMRLYAQHELDPGVVCGITDAETITTQNKLLPTTDIQSSILKVIFQNKDTVSHAVSIDSVGWPN